MRTFLGTFLILFGTALGMSYGQPVPVWQQPPSITVIGKRDDPRVALVDEAVSYWNGTLLRIGSAFRLGPVTVLNQPVPEELLRSVSQSMLTGQGNFVYVPSVFNRIPGDIIVVLGDSDFVSFTSPFFGDSKRVVGIRGMQHRSFALPNVARNVIAHELGHAIGLRHNDDPTKLMCGRPSPCRPDSFQSDEPRIFPLTDREERALLRIYPGAPVGTPRE